MSSISSQNTSRHKCQMQVHKNGHTRHLKTSSTFSGITVNENFSRATVDSPDGEEFVARILGNNKGFACVCQKVILYNEKETKIVPIDDFFAATKDNKFIKRLDYAQFVIDKMPDKLWQDFYDSFDVEPIRSPKTYLLRWNPTISSFNLDNYRDVLSKYPVGFSGMNWSVY